MTLRQQQSIFLKNFAELILWAFANGYEVTAGELQRGQQQHEYNVANGLSKAKASLHLTRMAGDLNLFINGVYTSNTADYKALGDKWVSMHPRNRWGGDWNKNGDYKDEKFWDGNHFEMQPI